MNWLFDDTVFMPAWMVLAYQLANAGIALACFLISATLVVLWWRSAVLPKGGMVRLFAAFILAFGCMCVLDVVVFYWPAYQLVLAIKIVTAVISLATACLLPRVVLHLLTLVTPEEYEQLVARLRLEIEAREARERHLASRNEILRTEADAIRAQITRLEWRDDIKDELVAMREHLHRIRGA